MALSSFLGLASAALIVILLGIYKPYLPNENANAASTESILVQLKRAASPPTFERDTLVLYILRPEDAEALESLQYFLEHAINLDRGRGKYVILVPKQQSEASWPIPACNTASVDAQAC